MKRNNSASKAQVSGAIRLTKKTLAVFLILFSCVSTKAQMSGSYPVPGTFTSIAAAVSSLNAVGISGAVSIDIAAGYTETAPVGGYSLTATGVAGSSIVFQKSGAGANPLITAYSGGTATPGSAVQDGVFRLIGSDYVIIASIDIVDLNTSNPATMEFGFGLYKASATDGCQHNLIVSCNITLSTLNNGTGIMPALHGSRGIDVVNALPTANTTSITITSASGSNSYNNFPANTIKNCNYGVSIVGFADVSPFTFSDVNNVVTGCTLANFGGAPSAANPAGGILAYGQQSLSITGNNINTNDGTGTDHVNKLQGIYVDVASGSATGVLGNTITLHGGGTSSQLTGIETTSSPNVIGASLNINGNAVSNSTYSTATTGNFYGIFNSAACISANINGNNFINNSTASASGDYYNIYNTGLVSSMLMMTANTFDGLNFTAPAVSSTVYNIYCATTGTNATVMINGNNFRNISFLGTSGSTGLFSGIYFTASASSAIITGNTFGTLSLKSSGLIHFIHHSSNTPVINVFGNTINTGFTRTLNSGDTYFYYGNNTAATGTTAISFNAVKHVSQTGTSAFYGIYNNCTALQKQEFLGNVFDTISSGSGLTSIISTTAANTTNYAANMISHVTAGGTIHGIDCSPSGTATTRDYLHHNIVHSFTATSASTVSAIRVSPGSQATLIKNKIYDILNTNAGGTTYGIHIAGSTGTLTSVMDTLANNLIGDLHASAASGTLPVAGIYIDGGTKVHVVYNTVNLNTTSSGSLFGSTALFASTTPSVELRNNILVNTSSPAGAGVTSAYRRSGTNLSTYMPVSNNNLFYAGPVALGHSIFYDGTTAYSFLSAFKTLVSGRDIASVTENPPFISTQGSTANYLDIDPSIATQVESGALPVAVLDDYSSNTRNTTTPDIGAWENAFTASNDLSEPALLGSGFTTSNCSGTVRTLTTSLTDISGVAGGLLAPRVYYKVNSGTYSSAQGALTAGTALNGTWSFNLNYTAVGGDVISYYVVAQDIAATPNVLASPANGFSGSNVNTVISAPATPDTYTILTSPVLSIASVSACAGNSATLSASGTGAATYTWSGPLSFSASTQTVVIPASNTPSTNVYTLTALSAAGCSVTLTASVTTNALPVITASTSAAAICAGKSSQLSATGGSTYSWMPGSGSSQTISVSPVATTVYTVTGTNTAGCISTASVQVLVNALPVLTASASSASICPGESTQLSVTGGSSYSWTPGSSSSQTISVSPAATTVYTVTGTNTAGCVNTASVEVALKICTGIDAQATTDASINLYPNPTPGNITVTFGTEGSKEIIILNSLGEVIHHSTTAKMTENFDLGSFAKGVYFMKVLSPSGNTTSKIIVK